MADSEPKWITAAEALALVAPGHSHINYARAAIVEYAKGRLVGSRSRTVTTIGRHASEYLVETNVLLDPGFWHDLPSVDHPHSDWVAGVFRSGDSRVRATATALAVEFLESDILMMPGVGLPSGIAAGKPASDPKAKTGKASPRELATWAAYYLKTRPGLVFEEIAEAAGKHFAGRNVTRDPLRSAIKTANYPVKRGKRSTKDIREKNTPANIK